MSLESFFYHILKYKEIENVRGKFGRKKKEKDRETNRRKKQN